MLTTLFNMIKYSRFRFRRSSDPCVPVGPDFKWTWAKNIRVAGNDLKINLPLHSPYISTNEQLSPKRDMVLDFPNQKSAKGVMADDEWRFSRVLHRDWRFNGPWFTGARASLTCSITAITRKTHLERVSYFHPKALEQAIAAYLTSSFSHEMRDGAPLWRAPVNWTLRSDLPVPAASFELLPNEEGVPGHCCVLPIDDHYFLCVWFGFLQHCPGFLAEKDQKISRAPMWELVNNILDSMTLTLSPENQAKVDKIKAECPDYSLSETFPPLKWPVGGNTASQSPEPLKIHAS